VSLAGETLGYDTDGHMQSSILNSLTTSYYYDADGRRVMKQTGTNPAEIYVYDAAGDLALEAGVSAPACKTCFVAVDALGSTRETVDTTGTAVGCHDYLPFGEELAGVAGRTASCWSASDTTARFTGKERDTETANSAMPTGLDFFGARYFSGAQGRFTSPDPELIPRDISNPQIWNKYAYTLNNPLKNVDPDGQASVPAVVQQMLQKYAPTAVGALSQAANRANIVTAVLDWERRMGAAPPMTLPDPVHQMRRDCKASKLRR
jgi:RHS repeat-associated protein